MVEHLNTEEYMMSNEELGGKTVDLLQLGILKQ